MLTVICVSLIMMDIALLQVLNCIRPILIGVTIGLVVKAILNVLLIHHYGIVALVLALFCPLFVL